MSGAWSTSHIHEANGPAGGRDSAREKVGAGEPALGQHRARGHRASSSPRFVSCLPSCEVVLARLRLPRPADLAREVHSGVPGLPRGPQRSRPCICGEICRTLLNGGTSGRQTGGRSTSFGQSSASNARIRAKLLVHGFLGLPWAFWGLLGACWGPPAGLLGASCGPLGTSCGSLVGGRGGSWASWGLAGLLNGLGGLLRSWRALGGLLSRSWGALGGLLRGSWGAPGGSSKGSWGLPRARVIIQVRARESAVGCWKFVRRGGRGGAATRDRGHDAPHGLLHRARGRLRRPEPGRAPELRPPRDQSADKRLPRIVGTTSPARLGLCMLDANMTSKSLNV